MERRALWSFLMFVLLPAIAWASDLGEMADVGNAANNLTGIMYLLLALGVVAAFVGVVMHFGRERLGEMILGLVCVFVLAIFSLKVIPVFSDGIAAHASTLTEQQRVPVVLMDLGEPVE